MTARKGPENTITLSAGIVLCFLIILSSFAQLIFNPGIYEELQDANDIAIDNREDRVSNVIGYLQGHESLRYFNEKERAHMEDVKGLVNNGFLLFYSLLAIFAVALAYLRDYRLISKALIIGSASAIGIALLSVLVAPAFDIIFLYFHQVFFNNDLWMLDPKTDMLIVMFPEGFFVGFAGLVLMRILLMSLAMLAISFAMRRLGSHREPAPGQ